ncbi:MAG: cytochrome c peroxidase [Anaerolineales bacterium]
MNKKWLIFGVLILAGVLITFTATASQAQTSLTPIEELGQFLYFDENLSEPAGQSCASCHDPDFGFDDQIQICLFPRA